MSKHVWALVVLCICGALGYFMWSFGQRISQPVPANPALASKSLVSVENQVLEIFGESHPARRTDHPIRFYRIEGPRCPFVEIGEVRTTVPWTDDETEVRQVLREGMEELARSIGGDGVGNLNQFSQTEVFGGSGVPASGTKFLSWSATVLRFVDPDCSE